MHGLCLLLVAPCDTKFSPPTTSKRGFQTPRVCSPGLLGCKPSVGPSLLSWVRFAGQAIHFSRELALGNDAGLEAAVLADDLAFSRIQWILVWEGH